MRANTDLYLKSKPKMFKVMRFLPGPVRYDDRLSSKEARNYWETEVCNIFTHHLKVNVLTVLK